MMRDEVIDEVLLIETDWRKDVCAIAESYGVSQKDLLAMATREAPNVWKSWKAALMHPREGFEAGKRGLCWDVAGLIRLKARIAAIERMKHVTPYERESNEQPARSKLGSYTEAHDVLPINRTAGLVTSPASG